MQEMLLLKVYLHMYFSGIHILAELALNQVC